MPRLIGIATHPVSRAPMRLVNEVQVSDTGIVGDKSRQGRKRHITILSLESWEEAREAVGSGDYPWVLRRANLLVEGLKFGPDHLGKRIRIGDDVVLEVTMECDPCSRMDEQVPGLQEALRPDWRGGVCTRVISGGHLAIPMEVSIQ